MRRISIILSIYSEVGFDNPGLPLQIHHSVFSQAPVTFTCRDSKVAITDKDYGRFYLLMKGQKLDIWVNDFIYRWMLNIFR
jgi:hypothetical protein